MHSKNKPSISTKKQRISSTAANCNIKMLSSKCGNDNPIVLCQSNSTGHSNTLYLAFTHFASNACIICFCKSQVCRI